MKAKVVSLVIALMVSSLGLFAQQDPMFTHYMFNLATVNPAAVGHGDYASVMNVNRYQWVGFKGAPETHSLNADIPIKFFHCGAGLTYVYDKIGPEKTNNLYADYAFHFKVSDNLRLGLGLKAGFKIFSASLTNLSTTNVDPNFASNVNGKFTPNFGAGAFLYNDKFYVGLSSPKVLNHKYVNSTTGGEMRHFFLIGGYVMPINQDVVFKPSVYFKYVEGAPISYDLTANFLIKNTIWFGVMYRRGDALGFLTQVQINNRLHIGYTYDMTLSALNVASKGTHELMITYEFNPSGEKVRSPRYF